MDNNNLGLSCLGLIVLYLILVGLSAVINGWALMTLWGWFIVALFEAAPMLDLGQAVGLALVVGFLTKSWDSNKSEGDSLSDAIGQALAVVILRPALSVAFGWVVASLMGIV